MVQLHENYNLRVCARKKILIQHSKLQGFVYMYCSDSTNKTVQDILPKDLTEIKWIDYRLRPEVFYNTL